MANRKISQGRVEQKAVTVTTTVPKMKKLFKTHTDAMKQAVKFNAALSTFTGEAGTTDMVKALTDFDAMEALLSGKKPVQIFAFLKALERMEEATVATRKAVKVLAKKFQKKSKKVAKKQRKAAKKNGVVLPVSSTPSPTGEPTPV